MSNRNGGLYGLTTLFPIISTESGARLRARLRAFNADPRGSPLAAVPIIHMSRFVVIDRLPYQEFPAHDDHIKGSYLLFCCDFDGADVSQLIHALLEHAPDFLANVWSHCAGFPTRQSADRIAAYFERRQLETNLYFVDRPDDTVEDVLRALRIKRAFAQFVIRLQRQNLSPDKLQREFLGMWRKMTRMRMPAPGTL